MGEAPAPWVEGRLLAAKQTAYGAAGRNRTGEFRSTFTAETHDPEGTQQSDRSSTNRAAAALFKLTCNMDNLYRNKNQANNHNRNIRSSRDRHDIPCNIRSIHACYLPPRRRLIQLEI